MLLKWVPRVLSVLFCIFMSLFALDALGGGAPLGQRLLGFLIHLGPSFVLALIAWLAWKMPRIGGVVYLGLALFYGLVMSHGRLDWSLIIAGPAALVGLLFILQGSRKGL